MKRLLSKQTYMLLRKASFNKMEAFIVEVYNQGYQEGQSDGLTNREVYEVLRRDAGLDEETATRVVEALINKSDEEYNQEYACGNCGADLTRYKEAIYCPFCAAGLEWSQEVNDDGSN